MKKITFYLLACILLVSLSSAALNYSFGSLTFRSPIFNNDEQVEVITSESSVNWMAEKVSGYHEGNIAIKSAEFLFEKDLLVGGEVIIDMNTINCTDLRGTYKNKLEQHLNSDDFFNVTEYPISTLIITSARKLDGDKYSIKADLTIKNITDNIEFEAFLSNGKATSDITIDRTLYDIKYGSGTFFENLGDRMIDDKFKLSVDISY